MRKRERERDRRKYYPHKERQRKRGKAKEQNKKEWFKHQKLSNKHPKKQHNTTNKILSMACQAIKSFPFHIVPQNKHTMFYYEPAAKSHREAKKQTHILIHSMCIQRFSFFFVHCTSPTEWHPLLKIVNVCAYGLRKENTRRTVHVFIHTLFVHSFSLSSSFSTL